MTLNLLLFAITFTIFLEIEFDFIFYVPYRSEEISPAAADGDYDEIYDDGKDGVDIKDDDGNGHLCSMSMHWPSLQVNSPSEQVVSFIRFTCTPSKCQRIEKVVKIKIKMKIKVKRIEKDMNMR